MWLQEQWYKARLHPLLFLLTPLSLLFWLVTNLRRSFYFSGLIRRYKANVPVIVVGNISVGGTGKTPMVIALCQWLKEEGWKPGVISRGYGGKGPFPHSVSENDDPNFVGDEPLLMRRRTACPVVIAPKRAQAAQLMSEEFPDVDVIISDDGLQHYGLKRDIELIMLDAERGTGNGWLLPAGPLREGPWRLKGADWVISNYGRHAFAKHVVDVEPGQWHRVDNDEKVELKADDDFYAIAGIGYPQRFFNSLSEQGIKLTGSQGFNDHHVYREEDFSQLSSHPILMTEKDASKCQAFAQPNWYYQTIEAKLPEVMKTNLLAELERKKNVH
ncbi:tetraacyldisaccharide 4'-kinase [Idiomarina sp. HP20-50]|uniref:tetraacyldisaccharide 4'-kinase n=1 Tax=Idiomarina sp. HP20-50 TaxID=3070813 RepID=UPI00294B4FC2|nr:tetraacyldisaccharide 4'-kinase [Idiomarina sp. HP20-50]MDV6314889.1 tetraacyldisaccharide 4'-kinase [Idiomarina sp. HP20-50]